MLPPSYFLDYVYARRISAKPSATLRGQYQAFIDAGTLGTSATSQQCCPTIFMVPMMGFFVGAKIFLPAIAQSMLVSNVLQPAWFTALNAFMTQAINPHAGPLFTWQMGIYSRKLRAFSSVQGYHPSTFIGFMARRKIQSGRYRHKKKH